MTLKSSWDILDKRMKGEFSQKIEIARSFRVLIMFDQ